MTDAKTITPMFLTLSEAAAALGVCSRTMMRWYAAGGIKMIKLGSTWRVTHAEMERLSKEGVPSYEPTPEHRVKMRENMKKARAGRAV
jgi:excisionase family DNA binding protein